jgi:hypothetical protein
MSRNWREKPLTALAAGISVAYATTLAVALTPSQLRASRFVSVVCFASARHGIVQAPAGVSTSSGWGVIVRRDRERVKKLRIAVRYLVARDVLERGHQSRLAEHFDVSRQRVHQVVNQERARRLLLIERVKMLRSARATATPD